MPLYLFYTMVQKSQKWPKTQNQGGGSCLKEATWIAHEPWLHWTKLVSLRSTRLFCEEEWWLAKARLWLETLE